MKNLCLVMPYTVHWVLPSDQSLLSTDCFYFILCLILTQSSSLSLSTPSLFLTVPPVECSCYRWQAGRQAPSALPSPTPPALEGICIAWSAWATRMRTRTICIVAVCARGRRAVHEARPFVIMGAELQVARPHNSCCTLHAARCTMRGRHDAGPGTGLRLLNLKQPLTLVRLLLRLDVALPTLSVSLALSSFLFLSLSLAVDLSPYPVELRTASPGGATAMERKVCK